MLLTWALALLIGAAVDVTHAFVVRAQLTASADAAALAGADQLDLAAWRDGRLALDPAAAKRAAQADIDGSSGAPGSVQTDASEVDVVLERRFPTFALRLVGVDQLVIRAEAIARPQTP